MDIASSIIEKFQHVDDTIDIDESNLTPVQEFYKGAKVFVTGFTGFLGQILVEKLLRSCPVSTVYVLMRKKKGKDIEVRLQEIFDNHLFSRMKKNCPDFRAKVVAIEGDCALPDLGLSDQDKKLLIDEVNIVFHVAATVRFDEKLKTAVATNVRATRDLLLLVKQMPHVKSYLHVSTAYSNCIHDVIEERVYPPAMGYKDLIEISECLDSLLLDNMQSHFLGNYPNTYVYSKQVAEDVVKQLTKDFPAGIFRPSIVISTYKEPIRGWINNFYGATGVFYGSGVGLLRVLYCDEESVANIVPVDMCVNGLIASAWDVGQRFDKAKEEGGEYEMPVYNYESTNDKPINWKNFMDISSKYGLQFPPVGCIWVFFLYLVKSYFRYIVLVIFLHFIPCMLVDAMLFFRGKKMRMMKAYKKIHTFSSLMAYFCVRSFKFHSANVHKMLDGMTKKDRGVFFCDLRELDWDEFFQTYGIGARVYLAKDPLDTIPKGRKFYRRLQWAHNTVKTVLGLLGVTILWLIMSGIYKLIFLG
ncbi:fatty acyl-CoA reductase wat-like [Anoplophora glabripennis]|uniref:fatty acyl-CoA reductase wat-like n=1 Tax=Anoplophora glabripennis TaxID=217634 RepID=UPI0008754BB6|nr:fatty acyl-CoA reductase wat-like [Anoplophora glabripennis]